MKYNTEKVWDDFSNVLRAYISRKISNHTIVEDVLQDVFVKIHMSINSLKEHAKIKNWVFQIARNTVIDYYKKRKRRIEDADSIYLENNEAFLSYNESDMDTSSKEIALGLKGMIEALPEKYAQALMLVEFEGKSQIELVKELGISISGIKSRVQRGRLMLKESLLRCCRFEFDRYGTIIDYYPNICCP